MLKKHDYSALLKYMHMLEEGYSINYIHTVSLVQASIKYGVSASRLGVWLSTYRAGGIKALSITKKRGRPPGMGRPKKVQKPETELERLRRENQELKTENALLKVKALVEEREARLRAIGRGQSEN